MHAALRPWEGSGEQEEPGRAVVAAKPLVRVHLLQGGVRVAGRDSQDGEASAGHAGERV